MTNFDHSNMFLHWTSERVLYSVWAAVVVFLLLRLDEAAVSLQKEKNMYKDIENYPTCFKVQILMFYLM